MKLSTKRWLMVYIYIIAFIILCEIGAVHSQRTFLDKFINEYRKFRVGLFKFIGRSDTDAAYQWNLKRQVSKRKMLIDHNATNSQQAI